MDYRGEKGGERDSFSRDEKKSAVKIKGGNYKRHWSQKIAAKRKHSGKKMKKR